MVFRFKNESKEFGESLLKYVMKLQKQELSKIILEQNMQQFHHGMKWSIPRNDGIENSGLKKIGVEIKIDYERVRNNDAQQLFDLIREFVSGFTSQFSKSMYEEVSKSCEQVGNVVNKSLEMTNAESFIAMLEKIEFSVNEDGVVEMPSLHVSKEFEEKLKNDKELQCSEFTAKVKKIRDQKVLEAKERELIRKNKFKGLNL